MIPVWLLLVLLAASAPAAAVQGEAPAAAVTIRSDVPAPELYRLRITNRAEGPIEISTDQGRFWEQLGRVLRPATSVIQATGTLDVAVPGAVAGVGPEQLLLRLPGPNGALRSLRILARGEKPPASAILTDIPPRGPLFRTLAPPLGSGVQVERDGKLEPLPPDYLPRAGDRLVVLVSRAVSPKTGIVTIENRPDGSVVFIAPSGEQQLVAKVKQPLRGIGRYNRTNRAGAGAVLCWTPTAVLVSTSGHLRRPGEGDQPPEERGGFVIQPAEPSLHGVTHPPSQLLIEAVKEGESPPAVSRFFGLPIPLSSCDPVDPAQTHVEVRIDGGEWEPMPDLRGTMEGEALLQALARGASGTREVKTGITHLRIIAGAVTDAAVRRRIRLAAAPEAAGAQRGAVKIAADVMGEGVKYVCFYLDGHQVNVVNQAPYVWNWDTRTAGNGEHLLEIRGLDARLAVITVAVTRVIVDN